MGAFYIALKEVRYLATVSSTIKMMDAMTGPLKSIVTSMNLVIRSFEQMQAVTERNTNVDRTLTAAKKQIASAEAEIRRQIEETEKAQNKFNRSVERSERNASQLLSTIKSFAVTYMTFESIKGIGRATFGGAMEQQQMIDTFAARAGNDQLGAAIYDQITRQALKAGQDVNEALSGTMSFMANTLDPKQLAKLNKLAMRLAKLNPAEGLEGAAFSMKELLSGDYTSIVERFNIGRGLIQNSAALKAGKAGNIEGFIKGMDDLLNKQNMTEKAFERMLESPAAKWKSAINILKYNLASAGQAGLEAFTPLIDKINSAFQSGKLQPFFDQLSKGLLWAAEGVSKLYNGVVQIYNFISGNWSIIEPVVWGIVGAFGAWLTITTLQKAATGLLTVYMTAFRVAMLANIAVTQGLTAAWGMLNTVQKANVFILLISAIVALVLWLYNLWQTNDNFAAALMRAWNAILNFFDQIPIFFARVGIGIINAFQWAKVESLKLMEQLVNGVIDDINWLIEKLNKIPGVSLDVIGQVEFSSKAAAEAEAVRQAGELGIKMMETDAARKAAEREQKVLNMLDNRAAKRAAEEAAKEEKLNAIQGNYTIPNIDKVGEVGKIKDKVDISSEDLKMMRELAEMKNIQNFVTLTPTVQVTTGPVNKESDIDTIIARIETALTEQIASSAKGVYG
jgi:hypothetical protein